MSLKITSLQNPLIKEVLRLQEKSRLRKKTSLFCIEGKREISLAIQGGYTLAKVLYCDEIFETNDLDNYCTKASTRIQISKEVYQKIAHRSSTEGIIAIAECKTLSLENLILKNTNPLLLVAEAPEKPGNIGAILRTADAANVDAVLIANPKTDIYNPNIIRSSVGCVFTSQIALASTTEIIAYLKKQEIEIYCAALTAAEQYHNLDYTKATAIVVGTEATGLSSEWLENATQNIKIPMQGQIDSLNVSVSAAIIIFEAKRQRNFQ